MGFAERPGALTAPGLTPTRLSTGSDDTVPEISGGFAALLAVLGALGGLGGLAGIAALVKSRAESRKTDAEGAEAITRAATGLLEPMRHELTSLRSRVQTLEVDQLNQRMLLVEHSVWDHLAVHHLAQAGIDVPPVPPLFVAKDPTASVEVKIKPAGED